MTEKRPERLLLKWGTIKGYDVNPDSPAHLALKRYRDLGYHTSSMAQQDTPEQKEILYEVIDLVDVIDNDWSGERMTKEQAKAYIKDYVR